MAFPVFRVVDELVPAAEAEGPAVAEVAVGGEGAEPADGQASLAKMAPAGALAAGDGERENFHRSALAPPANVTDCCIVVTRSAAALRAATHSTEAVAELQEAAPPGNEMSGQSRDEGALPETR
jgi:hypothetical protein